MLSPSAEKNVRALLNALCEIGEFDLAQALWARVKDRVKAQHASTQPE